MPETSVGRLGHPRGLSTLIFTQLWERFSYYGMRAFLILYLTAPVMSGGLGFDDAHAGSIYGTYTASIWLMPVLGGVVADRYLGAFHSVLIGGMIIAIGHFTLALQSLSLFYCGLALIVLGTGLLKPSVTTILGSLYDADDARRDAGFSILYMGINVGAFIGPLITGALAERVNYRAGFVCAGVGMTLGLIQYVLGRKRLHHVAGGLEAEAGVEVRSAVRTAGVRILGFTPTEWKRIGALCVFFAFAALFWCAYEQAGSTLNLFAERHTNRMVFNWTVPSSWFVSVQAMFAILLAPIAAWVWVRLGPREPSTPAKFTLGLLLVGLSFVLLLPAGIMAQGAESVLVSPLWLIAAYFLQVVGELCLNPVGNSLVTRLSPHRVVGMMMGLWFLSIALGNMLAGYTVGVSYSLPLTTVFGTIAAVMIAAALILKILNRPIRRLMTGVR